MKKTNSMDTFSKKYLELSPFTIVTADMRRLKSAVRGFSPAQIRDFIQKEQTSDYIFFSEANAKAASLLGLGSAALDLEMKKMLNEQFSFELVRYASSGCKKDFESDLVLTRPDGESVNIKLFIISPPEDAVCEVFAMIDITDYKLTEEQLFRQWLLHHSLLRLFMSSMSSEAEERIVDFCAEELSEIARNSVAFVMCEYNGFKYDSVHIPQAVSSSKNSREHFLNLLEKNRRALFATSPEAGVSCMEDSHDGSVICRYPLVHDGFVIAIIGIFKLIDDYDFIHQQSFESIGAAMKEILLSKSDQRHLVTALEQLEALNALSSAINSAKDRQTLISALKSTIKNLNTFMHPKTARFYFLNEGKFELYSESSADHSKKAAPLPDVVSRTLGSARIEYDSVALTGYFHAMASPVSASKSLLGAIELVYEDETKMPIQSALDVFYATGRQVGMAIDNIMLYEETRRLSLHDPLTGLANRRYMDIVIKHNMDMLRRSKKLFSLIMVDIDFFKNYNDTNGHEAGDHLLLLIAEIMRREVRSVDTVTRYGGEEFLIILPEVDETIAMTVAERIRKAVQQGSEVTVSMGVASCCIAGATEQLLIDKADKALYLAKTEGRNCVRLAMDTICNI